MLHSEGSVSGCTEAQTGGDFKTVLQKWARGSEFGKNGGEKDGQHKGTRGWGMYIQCLSNITNTSRLRGFSLDKCSTTPGSIVRTDRLSSPKLMQMLDCGVSGCMIEVAGAVALAKHCTAI